MAILIVWRNISRKLTKCRKSIIQMNCVLIDCLGFDNSNKQCNQITILHLRSLNKYTADIDSAARNINPVVMRASESNQYTLMLVWLGTKPLTIFGIPFSHIIEPEPDFIVSVLLS